SIPMLLTSLPSTNDYRNLSSERSARPLHDAYRRPESGDHADRPAINDAFNTWPAVCTHSLNGLTRPAGSRLSFNTA
ncbi:hypothetical protein ABH944_008746, partial [Caballeronia udeis]